MQQSIKQVKVNQTTLNIFSYTEETIHLYDLIMSEKYSKSLNSDTLEEDLAKFFNGLIWSQKKNPLLAYQMFEMKSCHKIVEKYINTHPIELLRNSILLLGNCEAGGIVAEQLIDHQYPHCLLTNILKPDLLQKHHQEVGEYIGSFMKCYYKLFRIQWLRKFILEGDYFELLEINLKYYNCLDFMARTNALNIVLDLLRHPQVRQFISASTLRHTFYITIFQRMCKLLRNQLAEFGLRISQTSKEDNLDYIFSELEDKVSLWFDIANNFAGIQHIIQQAFYYNVLLPLVIGPISFTERPLFTLKYSLFVINKLLSIIKRFCVLEIYIRILFIEDSILYYPDSLNKAFIQPFCLQKLLKKQIMQDEIEEKQKFEKTKDFYRNLFISKDNHFILMVNSLFSRLFNQAQSCPKLTKLYGFHYSGEMSIKICRILLAQLKDIHRLHTVESILDTLVSINNGKSLDTQLQNEYIYIFQHLMSQLKSGLNLSKSQNANQNIKNLAETIEYDLGITNKIRFGKDKDMSKYETIFKVVFEWELRNEQLKSKKFYARVPDSPAQYLRYLFVKFLYLKNARTVLLDNISEKSEYERYHQLMITHCPYTPEDLYNPNEIPQTLHICELLPEKEKSVLSAYFIKDDNFFIMGVPKNQRILIIQGINLKHITVEDVKKKKLKVTTKKFDQEYLEMVPTDILWIKIDSNLANHLVKKSELIISKNIQFVRECLQKTESQQPSASLI